jgi:hypothetical protein
MLRAIAKLLREIDQRVTAEPPYSTLHFDHNHSDANQRPTE